MSVNTLRRYEHLYIDGEWVQPLDGELEQLNKTLSYVEIGKQDGAELIAGGSSARWQH